MDGTGVVGDPISFSFLRVFVRGVICQPVSVIFKLNVAEAVSVVPTHIKAEADGLVDILKTVKKIPGCDAVIGISSHT